VDLRAGELRKGGFKIRLQEQPFQVLVSLLENPNEVVTREELRQKLWPADTFVDFDHGLNKTVSRIREALGDSAHNPRFVETVARRGYRFVAPSKNIGWPSLPSGKIMLAVLPFENLSNDPEQEYFADGLTEEMITQLGGLHPARLGVIARTSAMRYKHTGEDIAQIGKQLSVDYVLEGSVRRVAKRVRIATQLIQVSDRTHLWAESYEREDAEFFVIQREVSESVARSLALELLPINDRATEGMTTADPTAYEAYLQGRHYWHQLSEEGFRKSITLLQLAIQKDPNFARAYSALAEIYTLFGFMGLLPSHEVIPLARKATLTALKINDELADAHASLAGIQKNYDWNWLSAEQEYSRSLELNPNNASARWGYADLLSALGRVPEAMDEIHKAKELDPFSLVISVQVAWTLYMAGDFARSKEQSLKTLEMEPEFAAAHHSLGLASEQMANYEGAITSFENARHRSDNNSICLAGLGHAYAGAGRRNDAVQVLEDLKKSSARKYIPPYAFAILYTGLGDKDMGIEWLRKAFENRDIWLVWLKRDPRFGSLRSNPHVADLLSRMNFPD